MDVLAVATARGSRARPRGAALNRIETTRLVLATLTRDEAAAIREGARGGRAWADDYPSEGDLVVARLVGAAGDAYDEQATFGPMQVRRRTDGLAIGGIGFLAPPDAAGVAEIGYGLVASARGQGLATEALLAVLSWVRGTGIARVEAGVGRDNAASRRVLEKCGFVAAAPRGGDEGLRYRWP